MRTSAIPSSDKREIGNEAVITLSTAKQGNGVHQLRDNNCDTYWQSDGVQPHIISIQYHRRMSILEIALYLDLKLDESYTPKLIAIRYGTTSHDLELLAEINIPDPNGWVYINVGQLMQEHENVLSQFQSTGKGLSSLTEAISATSQDGTSAGAVGGGLGMDLGEEGNDLIGKKAKLGKEESSKQLGIFGEGRHSRHARYPALKASLIQCEIIGMHQNGRDTHVRQLKIYGPLT